jgi:hypothetical protein
MMLITLLLLTIPSSYALPLPFSHSFLGSHHPATPIEPVYVRLDDLLAYPDRDRKVDGVSSGHPSHDTHFEDAASESPVENLLLTPVPASPSPYVASQRKQSSLLSNMLAVPWVMFRDALELWRKWRESYQHRFSVSATRIHTAAEQQGDIELRRRNEVTHQDGASYLDAVGKMIREILLEKRGKIHVFDRKQVNEPGANVGRFF